MNVGFIGTGHMGNPIAGHLIKAGHQLTVHDKRQESTANLIELGAAWGDNPAAVAAASDVVFTSLPGPPEVEDAVLGAGGLLEGARPGMVHVDLTSNLPSAVRRIAQLEAAREVAFLDAPLAGMVVGALPFWPQSREWGYAPSAALSVMMLLVGYLWFIHRI